MLMGMKHVCSARHESGQGAKGKVREAIISNPKMKSVQPNDATIKVVQQSDSK